tara:strand:- start:209 stop:592 length:384 start_codon:yes stop_codon:yes gene_type:complete
MNKDSIFRLLNANKRPETFTRKPKENTLEVILYKYTGLKILKSVKKVFTDMKEDLTVIFKPVKRFNKNDLKPYDLTKKQKAIINPSYQHTPEEDVVVENNRTRQRTTIKFIDEQKNESQFNPDEYFF